jgi:hypothetical protein
MPAVFRAHQEKIGHVSAGDQQDHSNAAHQNQEARSDIDHNVVFQRQQARRKPGNL